MSAYYTYIYVYITNFGTSLIFERSCCVCGFRLASIVIFLNFITYITLFPTSNNHDMLLIVNLRLIMCRSFFLTPSSLQ